MSLRLGLQLFSVRDSLKKDFVGTLEQISKIGYQNLEFYFNNKDNFKEQADNLEADQLKKILDNLGLNAVSAHFNPTFWDSKKTLFEFIKYVKTLGISRLGVAIAFFKNRNDVLHLANQLNTVGKTLQENGITLYYHNHFQEFQQFKGESVLSTLLEQTEPDLVKVEFDTYWAIRAGVDPIPYIKKLGERCGMLHQKDLPPHIQSVNLFEKIGYDTEITMKILQENVKKDEFTETGSGIMDIPSIIEAFNKTQQIQYIFVEQDQTLKDPIQSITISFDYMSRLIENFDSNQTKNML
ncbi:TIM barrel protein [Aquibacillus halophilus]|uniref:TIM barrel protein n=1 Tax=Aquibacillus halophilus TaxID=930132 RepID=A0A6A8D7N5_9BACI|nr:sugar phosphate isomerase/epimerase [Aquibacillus halophilus]MRH41604.1 TIM barrel protein [Aquibacillus halophilus]